MKNESLSNKLWPFYFTGSKQQLLYYTYLIIVFTFVQTVLNFCKLNNCVSVCNHIVYLPWSFYISCSTVKIFIKLCQTFRFRAQTGCFYSSLIFFGKIILAFIKFRCQKEKKSYPLKSVLVFTLSESVSHPRIP